MANEIKTIFGLNIDSIKTINGIPAANIKMVNGLLFVQTPPIVWYGERGVFGGGNTGSVSNVLDYITIASAGNATDFGDLTVARFDLAACSGT